MMDERLLALADEMGTSLTRTLTEFAHLIRPGETLRAAFPPTRPFPIVYPLAPRLTSMADVMSLGEKPKRARKRKRR